MGPGQEKRTVLMRLRGQFSKEWIWRLFVALQIGGICGLIYVDVTTRGWSILPDFTNRMGRFDFSWQLFGDYYWTDKNTNWLGVTFLFGPVAVAKAVDWIAPPREQN